MSKKTSTGLSNKKNLDLNQKTVKDKLLRYLYRNVNIDSAHNEILLDRDLDAIKNGDYVICPRLQGVRSWIMYCKIDDVYYGVDFPKHNEQKIDSLKIFPINVKIQKDIYKGTIMEGIYFKMDDIMYLVIDEVYKLAGKDKLIKSKIDRLEEINKFLQDNVQQNPNFKLNVCQYYMPNKNSLTECYEKIKMDSKIQGLTFFPSIHGQKIFYYPINELDILDDITRISTFVMKKTVKSDVYNLYTLKEGSCHKFDIAFIPDMITSKMCKGWFKNSKSLLVKCRLDTEKSKWVPIQILEEYDEVISEEE